MIIIMILVECMKLLLMIASFLTWDALENRLLRLISKKGESLIMERLDKVLHLVK